MDRFEMGGDRMINPLRTFCDRVLQIPDRNVVIAIFAEFSLRAYRGHNRGGAATVMGRYVKNGTSGKPTSKFADLAPGMPNVPALWSFIAAAAKVQSNPFGNNPHPFIV